MRPDFDKLLTERARIGHSMKYHKVRNKKNRKNDAENLPAKEGMKASHKKYGRDWKYLNENLQPLVRFLNKQVGRPWNDVYSEIRKMMGKNPNAVKGHILQHLYGFGGVRLHTVALGDKRLHSDQYLQGLELSDGELFVDEAGIICRYQRKVKKKSYNQLKQEKRMETIRDLPDGNQLHKIKGIWYKVILLPILPKHIHLVKSTTVLFGKTYERTIENVVVNDIFGVRGSRRDFVEKYNKEVYAASKQNLNKKDLLKYNISND